MDSKFFSLLWVLPYLAAGTLGIALFVGWVLKDLDMRME
jgi:hypothetical protein